jgi:hypothetical protein
MQNGFQAGGQAADMQDIRHTGRQACRHAGRQEERHACRQAGRHASKQRRRLTDRMHAGGEANR